MFKFLSKIFKKKKETPDELDKALAQGIITKEELLRLRCERAEAKLKEFLKEKK